MGKAMVGFVIGAIVGAVVFMPSRVDRETIRLVHAAPVCATCADTLHKAGVPYLFYRGTGEVCVVRWPKMYEEVPMSQCAAAEQGEPK